MRSYKEQPLIFYYQIFALITAINLFVIAKLFCHSKILPNVFLMMLWITIVEIAMPIILAHIKISKSIMPLIYFLPFYLLIIPYLLNWKPCDFKGIMLLGGVLAVGGLLLLNKYLLFQRVNGIYSKAPISTRDCVLEIFMNLVAVFSEEIAFRAFWVSINMNENECLIVICGAFLFVYAHFVNRWALKMYKMKNYVMLFVLGMVLTHIYVETYSIVICCLLHIMYNISDYIILIKRKFAKQKITLFNDYE